MATTTVTIYNIGLSANQTSRVMGTLLTGQSDGITVTSVAFGKDSTNPYLTPNGTGKTLAITIQGTTSGSKQLWSKVLDGTDFPPSSIGTVSGSNTLLKGDIQLVMTLSGAVNLSTGFTGGSIPVTLTYELYRTKCGAPTSVDCARTRGTVTITWEGATAGANNPITKYRVLRNTSASTSGATTISTNATSGLTNAPSAGTYYYGVRAECAAGSTYYSSYKWSSSIVVPSKPSVAAGDDLTAAQMDLLKTWINGSQTNVDAGNDVLRSQGITYKTGIAVGDDVTAEWYNAAADG